MSALLKFLTAGFWRELFSAVREWIERQLELRRARAEGRASAAREAEMEALRAAANAERIISDVDEAIAQMTPEERREALRRQGLQ